MGCLRNNIELDTLMNDIESGDAFQWSDFSEAESGNLSEYVAPEYYELANHLIDVCPGGNGGMASVGRGEFCVIFMSGFNATPLKNGKGDVGFPHKNEEVKYNGGKIMVSTKQGRDVNKDFNKINTIKLRPRVSFLSVSLTRRNIPR